MEIINKTHKDILFNKRLELVSYINFYNESEIHFSVHAVQEFNLRIGTYVHFINDDKDWFFYINDDKDGFCISESGRRGNVSIFNGSLVKLFIKRTGSKLPIKHPLKATKMEKNGSNIIKIETELAIVKYE